MGDIRPDPAVSVRGHPSSPSRNAAEAIHRVGFPQRVFEAASDFRRFMPRNEYRRESRASHVEADGV